MDSLCAGCNQTLHGNENLTCVLCKNTYDLECANVSIDRFTNKMTLHLKDSWHCQSCLCKRPKIGNTNTPIRLEDRQLSQQKRTPLDDNVTIRKRTIHSQNLTIDTEDFSLLGDTPHTQEISVQAELTLEKLSEIIILRLKENNKSIITELKHIIQSEINEATTKLRVDIEQKTDALRKQNDQRIEDIGKINRKIENLEKENEKLKKEIKDLLPRKNSPNITCTETNLKRIVLYGFAEFLKEPEYILHSRLIELFRDTMNVDLTGYIEDTYRIGRNNSISRPLVIELISKRMSKYVIENGHCLKGTRLFISEYLDDNARKERHLMREEMLKARRNGLYAIIRNNQLFVEGQIINLKHGISTAKQNNNSKELEQTTQDNCNYTQLNQNNYQLNTNEATGKYSFRKHRPTI